MRGRAAHPRREPKYLFDRWPAVTRSVCSAARVALFLDFDGTLAPFRRRPEQVRMGGRTRRALECLVRDPRMSVYVLSGRRRADVEKRVAVRGVRFFGLHGWEGSAPVKPNAGNAQVLREARRHLRARLASLRGVWIEEKGPIFAVHARGATAAAAQEAGDIVGEVVRAVKPGLRVMRGSQVWEITPPEMRGKGAAVRKLLDRLPTASTLAFYVGDDTTDESAFSRLPDGITVVVGARRPTKAKFALRGPREVCLFLERLGRELRVEQR